MRRILILALSLVFGFSLVGCESTSKTAMTEKETMEKTMMGLVKGSVGYRERIALPPEAVVTVILEDVSLMDVAAKKIAEQTFTTDGAQAPFDFELRYNTSEIKANHRYSVRATIKVNGKLRFTTDTLNQVMLTDPANPKELNLMMVRVR